MTVKNIFVYYLAILLPIPALVYLAKEKESTVFVICFFSYLLLYRPVVDRLRLLSKGVITMKEAKQFHFLGLSHTYFKDLYLP